LESPESRPERARSEPEARELRSVMPQRPPRRQPQNPELDQARVASLLASAANRATGCARSEGPHGSGLVRVLFNPDGPVVATPDEIADPYAIELHCRVERKGKVVFSGSASTGQLKRRFEEIVSWLIRCDAIPTVTVLSTGTGIIQPMDVGLEEGDEVILHAAELGELRNPVAVV
jgi:hypothetical protein